MHWLLHSESKLKLKIKFRTKQSLLFEFNLKTFRDTYRPFCNCPDIRLEGQPKNMAETMPIRPIVSKATIKDVKSRALGRNWRISAPPMNMPMAAGATPMMPEMAVTHQWRLSWTLTWEEIGLGSRPLVLWFHVFGEKREITEQSEQIDCRSARIAYEHRIGDQTLDRWPKLSKESEH